MILGTSSCFLALLVGPGWSILRWKLDLHIWRSSFQRKWISWYQLDSYGVITGPQKHSEGSVFHHAKWSKRSGAIKPTLYTKKLKNRLKTALGLNDDKMIVLVQPQKVLGWSWFFVCELVILLPLTGHHNQARSSLHQVPRWAQARPLFQIVRTMRFCAKYVTDQKWRWRPYEAL